MSECAGVNCTHPECRGTGMHYPDCKSRRCKGCLPASKLRDVRTEIGPLGLPVEDQR